MKKILLFLYSDDLQRGGAERILKYIADYYAKEGYIVCVLFLREKVMGHWEVDKKSNVHLYYGGRGLVKGMVRFVYNLFRLKKNVYDISFTSIVDYTAIIGLLRRLGLLKVKTMVARESTSIFKRFSGLKLFRKKLMYWIGYPAVDVIVCQTESMKVGLVENMPHLVKNARVVVLPNPIDLSIVKTAAKEKIEISHFSPYIVSAGRLIPEKGFDVLISSFELLLQKYPHLKLVILGDGIWMSSLRSQIEAKNLNDSVFLYGSVSNVYPFFRQAKLCVVSSRIEGFPNVLLQMMSQNTRVVSTLCAGGVDSLDGVITCRPDDVKSLYEAMLVCLTVDPTKNREKFDKELQHRTVASFVERLNLL